MLTQLALFTTDAHFLEYMSSWKTPLIDKLIFIFRQLMEVDQHDVKAKRNRTTKKQKRQNNKMTKIQKGQKSKIQHNKKTT